MNASTNIDAAQVLEAVANAGSPGLANIIIFIILIAGTAYIAWRQYVEHQDRKETKKRREQEWEQHTLLHQENDKAFQYKLEMLEKNFSGQLKIFMENVNAFIKEQKEANKSLENSYHSLALDIKEIKTKIEMLGK
jgi:uncharacterized protein HemX